MLSIKTEGVDEVSKTLEKYAKVAGIEIADAIIEQAATVTSALMRGTIPYGATAKTKNYNDTENAVRRDINKVYDGVAKVAWMLGQRNKRWEAIFLNLAEKDMAKAASFASAKLGRHFVFGQFNPQYHQSQRDSRGHVKNVKEAVIVENYSPVKRYKERIVGRVGTAKAGFAAALRKLGRKNTRIPAYVRRNMRRARGDARIHRAGWGTEVTITNDVSYIRNVLPDRKIRAAIARGQRGSLKRMEKAVEKARLNTGL